MVVWKVRNALVNFKETVKTSNFVLYANEFHRGKKGETHCVCPLWCQQPITALEWRSAKLQSPPHQKGIKVPFQQTFLVLSLSCTRIDINRYTVLSLPFKGERHNRYTVLGLNSVRSETLTGMPFWVPACEAETLTDTTPFWASGPSRETTTGPTIWVYSLWGSRDDHVLSLQPVRKETLTNTTFRVSVQWDSNDICNKVKLRRENLASKVPLSACSRLLRTFCTYARASSACSRF